MAIGYSKLLLFTVSVLNLLLSTLTLGADPYLHVICTGGNYTKNSTYEKNIEYLNTIFSQLTSRTKFYHLSAGENPDIVNGIVYCRGDINQDECGNCLNETVSSLMQRCPFYKEAIGWSEFCMLRYANRDIFEQLEDSPATCLPINDQDVTNRDQFNQKLSDLLTNSSSQAAAGGSDLKFAAGNSTVGDFQSVYVMVQCTPDLSEQECGDCLTKARDQITGGCCLGKVGCRVLIPSCFLAFDSSPFNQIPVPTGGKKQGESPVIAIVASLSAFFGITLLCSGGFFLWRRIYFKENEDNHRQDVQLVGGRNVGFDYSNEDFQKEDGETSQEFPSIQLDILHAATNHFSFGNKLGEGGFGPVYKGTLPDGKEIAVKRLSITSGQGLLEFKNEVMLIARLQHRNLVRLLGCCLEKNEKLLVYEYMPNKSLDVFLFNSSTGLLLDWPKRFTIINGIARGIMYLHEDSRLRIIHRDLKASNVLLDGQMNPKISDFGMARIFGGNQSQANTNRVVGTYGYMAPEYAMQGLFSVKSDVFSFGVLLLEIISGKRNSGFYIWEHGESLLTFAWKQWSKGQGMEVMDEHLVESCVVTEVLKCIHIGLLCVQEDPADRPSMSQVIVMLASDTITLPRPSEPAFSVSHFVAEEQSEQPNTSEKRVFSNNDVTMSSVSPR